MSKNRWLVLSRMKFDFITNHGNILNRFFRVSGFRLSTGATFGRLQLICVLRIFRFAGTEEILKKPAQFV